METRKIFSTVKMAAAGTAVSVLLAASAVQAATMMYHDKATFDAAVSGLWVSTEDFEGTAAGTTIATTTGIGDITYTYSFGGVQLAVTDGAQFGGGGPFVTTSGSNFLGTDDGDVLQGGDDITFSFAATHAIGLYIISAENPFVPKTIFDPEQTIFSGDLELTINGGSVLLDVSQGTLLSDDESYAYFLGIYDDTNTFTEASLTAADDAIGAILYNIDDIILAQEHTVPEPGTLALFGLGLAGLGFARRRKAS